MTDTPSTPRPLLAPPIDPKHIEVGAFPPFGGVFSKVEAACFAAALVIVARRLGRMLPCIIGEHELGTTLAEIQLDRADSAHRLVCDMMTNPFISPIVGAEWLARHGFIEIATDASMQRVYVVKVELVEHLVRSGRVAIPIEPGVVYSVNVPLCVEHETPIVGPQIIDVRIVRMRDGTWRAEADDREETARADDPETALERLVDARRSGKAGCYS